MTDKVKWLDEDIDCAAKLWDEIADRSGDAAIAGRAFEAVLLSMLAGNISDCFSADPRWEPAAKKLLGGTVSNTNGI